MNRTRNSAASRNRTLATALGVPAVLLSLAACGLGSGGHVTATIDASANPAGATHPAQAPAGSASGSGASVTSGSGAAPTKGCTGGEAQLPRGAHSATTADLDGDGRADRIWLYNNNDANDLKRFVGVVFSAGGGTSTTFDSADPMTATAVAGRLANGAAMVLLDTGRSVHLYTVAGCKIVKTVNKQGAQYTFDKGFTGFGSGVGCPVLGASGQQLVGYLAGPAKGDVGGKYYKVTRTTITVSDGGRRATNGTTVTLGSRLGENTATVKTAFAVACGSSGVAKEGDF